MKFSKNYMNLYVFDETQTNRTTDSGLSPEMKTYYEKRLLNIAQPKLVHDQFGDKYPIPKNGGNIIELRKYTTLPKATNPIDEGLTPTPLKMSVNALTATVDQYGSWVELSDMFLATAIDNNLVQATKLLGSQSGRTLDTITREELNSVTTARYAPKISGDTVTPVASRADIDATAKLTPDLIFKAKADLSAVNADPIDDCYVGIIHPYAAYDLMRNEEWIDVHKYAQPENIYQGEIGKIAGVRFVETSEAKIFAPDIISDGKCRLTVKANTSSSTSVTVNEALTAGTPSTPIPVYVDGTENTITAIAVSNGTTTLTLGTAASLTAGDIICGKNAGKDGSAVFSTLIIGAHAYATTEIEGGGLEHITKPLGYGNDPLNQRASCGWKASKVAHIIGDEFMVRVESGGAYSATATAN